MRTVNANTIAKPNDADRTDSERYVLYICAVLFVLILARAMTNMAFYLFAVVSLAVFVCSSASYCFSLLLFLVPFASVVKLNSGDMSFFTVLYFVAILKMLIAKRTIHTYSFIAVMAISLYCLVFSGFGQLATIITMAAGLIMVYCLQSIDIRAHTCIVAFSLGIIGASLLALLKDQFPMIEAFITDSRLKLGTDNYTVRFAGLEGNPNYYTLNIIVVLSAVVAMIHSKNGNHFYGILLIPLSVFGLISVSKSFLLSWILLMAIWLLLSMKQGVGQFVKFLIIAIVAGAVVYFFAYDTINAFLFRLESNSGNSMNKIFTGRIGIWDMYIQTIFGDAKIFLLGKGLKTMEGTRGTHNTYLETIYSLGFIGAGLFLTSLKLCMGKVISRPVMWVPVAMLLFRMLAIGMLTYDNLWLYLGLLVVLAKENAEGINNKGVRYEKSEKNNWATDI